MPAETATFHRCRIPPTAQIPSYKGEKSTTSPHPSGPPDSLKLTPKRATPWHTGALIASHLVKARSLCSPSPAAAPSLPNHTSAPGRQRTAPRGPAFGAEGLSGTPRPGLPRGRDRATRQRRVATEPRGETRGRRAPRAPAAPRPGGSDGPRLRRAAQPPGHTAPSASAGAGENAHCAPAEYSRLQETTASGLRSIINSKNRFLKKGSALKPARSHCTAGQEPPAPAEFLQQRPRPSGARGAERRPPPARCAGALNRLLPPRPAAPGGKTTGRGRRDPRDCPHLPPLLPLPAATASLAAPQRGCPAARLAYPWLALLAGAVRSRAGARSDVPHRAGLGGRGGGR